MNTKQRGAEVIKKFVAPLRDLIDYADELETIGSMEQARAEAESRVKKLQQDEEAAKQRVAKAEQASKEAYDSAAAVKEQARAEADRIVADANTRARALTEKSLRDAEAKRAETAAQVTSLQVEIAALDERRSLAQREAQAAEEALADVQRRRKALAASLA